MNLQTRFPVTYALCNKHVTKPDIVIKNNITFDKSRLPTLSQTDIDCFIELQNKYPDAFEKCFNYLIEILEQTEKENTTQQNVKKRETKAERKARLNAVTPMDKIYETLKTMQINEIKYNDMIMIDNLVLFIKAQNDFSLFF